MGEKQPLEEFSEHIEYYKSLKQTTSGEIFIPIFSSLFVFLISWIIYDINFNTVTDTPPPLVIGITIISFILLLFSSHSSYSKRVNKAKGVLDGNAIQLKKPRMWLDYLFTHLHPDDIEIGKPIHLEYSEKLETGDLVLLTNAICTNYSSSSEEYYWEMPRENYGHGGMSMESERYAYSSYEDRYYSGTSTRTIHKAELKIPTNNIIFSCSQKMKKGDVLTLIAELKTFDEESNIQRLRIKKKLDHHHAESEE